MNERLLFIAKSAIFRLFHCENKLHFEEMILTMSVLLAYWNNSPFVDISITHYPTSLVRLCSYPLMQESRKAPVWVRKHDLPYLYRARKPLHHRYGLLKLVNGYAYCFLITTEHRFCWFKPSYGLDLFILWHTYIEKPIDIYWKAMEKLQKKNY